MEKQNSSKTKNEFEDNYDPSDYESEIEEFNQEKETEDIVESVKKDIFGNFFPTFYQYQWYEQTHLYGRQDQGILVKQE